MPGTWEPFGSTRQPAEPSERPWHDELRFDAVGVVVDRDGGLVSLDHLEGAF